MHFKPAFWRPHNNLCEFTTLEHKFKRWLCTQKPVWNVRFKEFWYTKINLTQTRSISMKGKKSLHTQHEFFTFNNYHLHSPNQIWVKVPNMIQSYHYIFCLGLLFLILCLVNFVSKLFIEVKENNQLNLIFGNLFSYFVDVVCGNILRWIVKIIKCSNLHKKNSPDIDKLKHY